MNFLLSAYLDHNIGDDLFVLHFCKRYSEHQIWLLCDNDFSLNIELESLPNLNKIGLKSAVKKMYLMDAFVLLGGSIFQDNSAFYKYDYRRNILVSWAKLLQSKVFIMGSNIGPIRSIKGERITRYCMALADGISVRDTFSMQLLQKWGLEKKSVCAPDLIFSYPLPEAGEKCLHRMGISVLRRGSEEEVDAYAQSLALIISQFLQRSADHEVRLYAFDGGQEDDSLAADLVIGKLPAGARSSVSVCRYTAASCLSQFISDFGSCGYIIGTRFHSIVLALKYGVRCMPIIYSEKTLNQLADVAFKGVQSNYSSMGDFDTALVEADVSQAIDNFKLAQKVIDSSLLHFSHLDRFVEGKS